MKQNDFIVLLRFSKMNCLESKKAVKTIIQNYKSFLLLLPSINI